MRRYNARVGDRGLRTHALSGSALASARHTAASPPRPTLPTIGGTARSGQTLTATSGAWDGATPISYAYQWQRCNSSGSGCGAIGKATNQNYVALVRRRRQDDPRPGDGHERRRLEPGALRRDRRDRADRRPLRRTRSSRTRPGRRRTARRSPSTTAAGRARSRSRSATSGRPAPPHPVCTDIAGATGKSFSSARARSARRCARRSPRPTRPGRPRPLSNLTAAVIAKASAAREHDPAADLRLGVGRAHAPGLDRRLDGRSDDAFGYQWSRCNTNGTSCASISGATGQSYGVGQVDLGNALRVSVTATNSTGSTSAISASSTHPGDGSSRRPASTPCFVRPGSQRPEAACRPGAAGHFTAKLTGKTLRWTLTFSHLNGRPTIAGLNKGLRGTNGAAFKTLCRTLLLAHARHADR